jgi:hypothetical protein
MAVPVVPVSSRRLFHLLQLLRLDLSWDGGTERTSFFTLATPRRSSLPSSLARGSHRWSSRLGMATLDSGMQPAEVVACGRGRKHGSEDPPLQKSKDAGLKPGATNAEKKADPSPPFPRQSLCPLSAGKRATGFGMTVGWWRASLRKFRVADGVEDQRKNRTTDEARV